jgi:hypothetical protein
VLEDRRKEVKESNRGGTVAGRRIIKKKKQTGLSPEKVAGR